MDEVQAVIVAEFAALLGVAAAAGLHKHLWFWLPAGGVRLQLDDDALRVWVLRRGVTVAATEFALAEPGSLERAFALASWGLR